MNSLPFYPLVWKTASGTFRGSLTWDMTLLCYADAHCGHWLCAAAGSAMARLAAARLCASTLGSLPPTRSGLPARAGNAGESIAAHPKVLQILPPHGRDDGYVGQYGVIRARQTDSSAASQELSAQRRACSHLQRSHSTINSSCTSLTRRHAPSLWNAWRISRLEGEVRDILGSLVTVLEEQRGTQPVGVLLLSDGAHHGADTGLGHLRQAGVRVVTVGVGAPRPTGIFALPLCRPRR